MNCECPLDGRGRFAGKGLQNSASGFDPRRVHFVPQCWNWQTGALCKRVPIRGVRVRSPAGAPNFPKPRTENIIVLYGDEKDSKRKRGPKEERLVIPDPQKTIDSLFKPKPKKG
jgi:hypothetical protein